MRTSILPDTFSLVLSLLIVSVFITGVYFSITGITYGVVILMPSILMLPTYQSYFALLGVVGLASTIIFSISSFSFETGIYNGVGDFVIGMVPFFIAIAFRQGAYIPSSFLNLSSINIAILTLCCLKFFFGTFITFSESSRGPTTYFDQTPSQADSLLPKSSPSFNNNPDLIGISNNNEIRNTF